MARQKLPPNPSQNLHEWASKLYEWLVNSASIDQVNDPTSVLLAHQTASILARANVDGILMFDPMNQTPVYSSGGLWVPFNFSTKVLVEYSTAFNVNGAALVSGNNKVPYVGVFNNSSWFTAASADTFTLQKGKYLLSGAITLALVSAGLQTAIAYVALASDLTTPVGTAISVPCAMSAVDVNTVLPFVGELVVPAGGETYALVVRTSSATFRLGTAGNLAGLANRLTTLEIAQIGT